MHFGFRFVELLPLTSPMHTKLQFISKLANGNFNENSVRFTSVNLDALVSECVNENYRYDGTELDFMEYVVILMKCVRLCECAYVISKMTE